MTKINTGDLVPRFKCLTDSGVEYSVDDLKGSPTVLYFYPKDNTSGCTMEACSLRDGLGELKRRGFKVVGVSPDSVKSHGGFIAKHSLGFTLLADTEHALSEAMGVWRLKKMCGREYMGIVRTTFLLDAEARVTHIIEKVDTKDSFGQIVKLLEK